MNDSGPPPEVSVAFGLGANLGDRLGALQRAIDIISQDPAVTPTAVSAVFETDPVGGPEQPDYLNAVLLVRTTLVPLEVLALAHLAEHDLHRTRETRWGARTLDVDIVSYGETTSDDPALTLPHPRAAQRAFVLVPLHSADPAATLAGIATPVAQLIEQLPPADVAGVRLRDDLQLVIDARA